MRRTGNAALLHVIARTIKLNRVRDGLVYLQVSRGEGPRDFAFPPSERIAPTLVVIARSQSQAKIADIAATTAVFIVRMESRMRRMKTR